jgi:hypothetical protein
MELLVGAQAQLDEAASKLVDALQVLGVGEVGVGGQLKELPLLVDLANLAVDVLLDLLGLLVQMDELAVADGVVVGVEAGTAADNVVDGVDALGGGVDVAILGHGVAARDGLVGDLFVAGGFNGVGRLVHLVERHDAGGVVHGGGCGRSRRTCAGSEESR